MLLEKPSPICASKVDEEEYSAAVVDSGTAYLTLTFEIYNAVTEIVLEDWNGHSESFEDDPEDQEVSGVASEDDEGGEGEDFIVYAGGNEETGDGEDGEDGEYGEYGEDGEMVRW